MTNRDEIAQPIGFDLSDEEYKLIGMVTVNWSAAEFFIGAALHAAHGGHSVPDEYRELLMELKAHRKLDLLTQKLRSNGLLSNCEKYIKTIRGCFSTMKGPRNIIAHGLPAMTQEGRAFISERGDRLDPNDLALMLQQSRYVLFICYWLAQTVGGNPHQPEWPAMPTKTT